MWKQKKCKMCGKEAAVRNKFCGNCGCDEFGQIMPCRIMPVIRGNIFDSILSKIRFNDEIFKSLRLPVIPEECSFCEYA